jgi:hypothetical protein
MPGTAYQTRITAIVYTIQREGGSVHRVSVDPRDGVIQCSCEAGRYDRECWAARLAREGNAGKPRVRCTQVPRRARVSEDGAAYAASMEV